MYLFPPYQAGTIFIDSDGHFWVNGRSLAEDEEAWRCLALEMDLPELESIFSKESQT